MASLKIPAAAYYRMSSDKQETSINDQRTAVEKYAQQNGYEIIREYADEGISGWKAEERQAFQNLIADAEKGGFEAVLCWDQDRFSRFPVMEANHYWHLLNEAGVHIATVSQGRIDFQDLGDWLKASVIQHGKAEFVKDLSRNVCRGQLAKRKEGKWLNKAPFGYQVENGKLQLGNPLHVKIVQQIFNMRLEGYGTYLIAKELNAKGYKTAKGATWVNQSVSAILERPAYVGDSVIGNHSRGKFNSLTNKPITIKDTHPAIVDRQTWEKANSMPKKKQSANGRGGADGAKLSGLIFCGRCGGKMYSRTTGKPENKRSHYVCANYSEGYRRDGEKCGCCNVERSRFEDAVFSRMREKLLLQDRTRLEAAIQKVLDRRKKSTPKVDHSSIKRQLTKLDQQIDKATERLLLIDADLLPDAQEKLRDMKKRREQLAATKPEPTDKPLPSASEIADDLWTFDETLRTGEPKAVRHVLSELVSGIVCDFEFDKQLSTPKRKRYRFTGAEIVLRSSEYTQQS